MVVKHCTNGRVCINRLRGVQFYMVVKPKGLVELLGMGLRGV